jgi:hypothetical protein
LIEKLFLAFNLPNFGIDIAKYPQTDPIIKQKSIESQNTKSEDVYVRTYS